MINILRSRIRTQEDLMSMEDFMSTVAGATVGVAEAR